MKVFIHQYNFLLFIAVIILVLSFLVSKTIDIHFHDTYYILSAPIFFMPVCLFLSLSWLFYRWTMNNLFSWALSTVHITLTLVSIIAFLFLLYFQNYFEFNIVSWNRFNRFNKTNLLFSSFVLIFLIAQIMFIINFIGSLFLIIRRWYFQ